MEGQDKQRKTKVNNERQRQARESNIKSCSSIWSVAGAVKGPLRGRVTRSVT